MTGTNLGEQVARAMARQRQLAAQRVAVAVVLTRYSAGPVARWAEFVARLDEPRPYHMLYRIAERGVSC